MTDIASGAAALSTYGLYCIVAVLAFVCYKLYVKTSTLEKEFREYIKQESVQITDKYEKIISDSDAVLRRIAESLEKRNL